ncbi:MAG TPA: S46 family peptidase, partial [Candidatus Polarisedimenticolia bacterium]|nr:S46 family peptidase [Candidatus Polarisedimenticolia bacterium]
CATAAARADEGMWTFDNFPSAEVQKKYGFAPDKQWLEQVRLASVRLAGGCSGSIVSESGLVMTNHHCARSCIQQNSTKEKDLMTSGFFAASSAEELKCPEIEVNQLLSITDITERMNAATKGLADKAYNDALKAEMSRAEKECSTDDQTRCDVVTLYHGGRYHLYKFRRFQDVRLVFAPEADIAHFGGDLDNFMFPRYCLDVSFLRLYDKDQPLKTEHYLKWSPTGPNDGDLAFVPGNPGSTRRLFTVAELEYERDVALPQRLMRLAEERGMLVDFAGRGVEQDRISTTRRLTVENAFKGYRGRYQALLDKNFFKAKIAGEQAFRAQIDGDPARRAAYGGAWDAIAGAKEAERKIQKRYTMLEGAGGLTGFQSTLFDQARTLVRAADELPKPNELRLREFADSKLPALKQKLFSAAPIYDEMEIQTLTFSLTKLREDLGPDDPLLKKMFGKSSARELAASLVSGSQLKDVAVRKRLFDGGKAAVEASDDAMIKMARLVDADTRAVRKQYEDEIESVLKKNDELIARASFEISGTGTYPDATFTPRVSYGTVKGFAADGVPVAPLTRMAGLYDRATGEDPFVLPESWVKARGAVDLSTPMNFSTTNDIIGGNSGSPVVDRDGRVSGLIFDGNIYSLGGDYGYDASINRAVAVHSAALLEALDKVYHATRIVNEIKPNAVSNRPRAKSKGLTAK